MWAAAAGVALALALGGATAGDAAQGPGAAAVGVLHGGMSPAMVSELNPNDARATLEVWGNTLAATRNIPLRVEAEVFGSAEEVGRALREGRLDLVVMRSDEYFAAGINDPAATRMFGIRAGEALEEYQVVVRRTQAPPPRLADLRGKSITLLDNSRSGLLPEWLDMTLLQNGLEPAAKFFGSVSSAAKLSRVVLPVFFGQQAACVVSRSGLRTMTELNPQVGRDVVVVATSPPIMPGILVLRGGFTRERAAVVQALADLDKNPRGQQVLNLFGLQRVAPATEAEIDAARQLYEAHARLLTRPRTAK
jgi:ABC-type phosphate/phosphonate transport system substrate-binding protein